MAIVFMAAIVARPTQPVRRRAVGAVARRAPPDPVTG
jgi:hypothetical protein